MHRGHGAAINASPEPFSNWAASIGEDLAVAGMLWLAIAHPIAALAAIASFAALAVWLLPKLWRTLRRLVARLVGWVRSPDPTRGSAA